MAVRAGITGPTKRIGENGNASDPDTDAGQRREPQRGVRRLYLPVSKRTNAPTRLTNSRSCRSEAGTKGVARISLPRTLVGLQQLFGDLDHHPAGDEPVSSRQYGVSPPGNYCRSGLVERGHGSVDHLFGRLPAVGEELLAGA